MTPDAKPGRRSRLIALALLLLAAGFLAWKFWPRSPATPPILATVRFADGSRIELLAVGVGTGLDDHFENSTRSTADQLLQPSQTEETGSSSYAPQAATIHRRSIEVEGATRLRGTKIVTPQPSLLLLLRGFAANGKPGEMDRQGRSLDDDAADAAASSPGQNAESKRMFTHVEIWTGESTEWQPIQGPHQPLDTDPRAFCYTAVFPRLAPKLRLRFTQKGQPPVELEIANPKPIQATSWKAESSLPITKRAGETDVTLRFDRWGRDSSGAWMAYLDESTNAPRDHFDVKVLSVEDASGNFAYTARIPLTPGFGAWKAKYEVKRSSKYPTPLAETILVADGEFVAVGKPLILIPDPAFTKQFGSFQIAGEARPQPDPDQGEGPLQFQGTATGVGPEPEFFSSGGAFWRIYVDGQPLPEPLMNNSWGVSRRDNTYKADFEHEWRGRLAPGTKFKLALQKPSTPVLLEFLFDPPPIPTVGTKIDGQPGYIKNPRDPQGRAIDVRGLGHGTKIKDPFFPGQTLIVP